MKASVSGAIEGMIAPLFDTRTALVRALEETLRRQAALDMKPIYESYHQTSGEFGLRSVELMPLPTILRLTAVSGDVDGGAGPQPDTPEVVAVTSFDAVPIRVNWQMNDGSTGGNDVNMEGEIASGTPVECMVLSVRDGYFIQRCNEPLHYESGEGVVHIERESLLMGIVSGNALNGIFQDWWRNFNVGYPDRDDVEYMRRFHSGRISGLVDVSGKLVMTMESEVNQTFDNDASWENDYLHYSGTWLARDMESNGYAVRTTIDFEIVGTAEQGTLLLPDLTADDVLAIEFELPPVFFQHGVAPPERVR